MTHDPVSGEEPEEVGVDLRSSAAKYAAPPNAKNKSKVGRR